MSAPPAPPMALSKADPPCFPAAHPLAISSTVGLTARGQWLLRAPSPGQGNEEGEPGERTRFPRAWLYHDEGTAR